MADSLSISIAIMIRLSLIALFLPFSALDKMINWAGAMKQAREIGVGAGFAAALICTGMLIEIVCSLGVLTGIADRLAAFGLAGYCALTALLYKRFWATGDFAMAGPSKGRDMFWDFLKNFAVAGGFLLITFGTHAGNVDGFLADPLGSTHPYELVVPAAGYR